jgi:rod shape determining protein RodA
MNDQTPTPFGTGVQRFGAPRARLLRLDFLLLGATLALLAFSVVTLDGALSNDGGPSGLVARQVAYAIVGIVLMLIAARIDYTRFRELRVGIYCTMVGLILLVLVTGGATRGSRRWLELPFFRFQPSELGKILLVLALSAFLIDRVRRLSDREVTSRIMLLALVPTLLVMLQPDLGTSIVYVAIALALLFVAGTKWTHFAALAVSRWRRRCSCSSSRRRSAFPC